MNIKLSDISRVISRQTLKAQKHSPALLFGAGLVGFVGTTVLASRATLKTADVVDEAQGNLLMAAELRDDDDITNYNQEEYNSDAAKVYAMAGVEIVKLYAPAVLVGVITVGPASA
jgi:hypothetical protein